MQKKVSCSANSRDEVQSIIRPLTITKSCRIGYLTVINARHVLMNLLMGQAKKHRREGRCCEGFLHSVYLLSKKSRDSNCMVRACTGRLFFRNILQQGCQEVPEPADRFDVDLLIG